MFIGGWNWSQVAIHFRSFSCFQDCNAPFICWHNIFFCAVWQSIYKVLSCHFLQWLMCHLNLAPTPRTETIWPKNSYLESDFAEPVDCFSDENIHCKGLSSIMEYIIANRSEIEKLSYTCETSSKWLLMFLMVHTNFL